MEFSGRRIPTVAHAIPAVTTATYPRKLSESTPEEAPLVFWERILIAKGEIRHDLIGETVLMCARFGNYGSDAVLFRIRSGMLCCFESDQRCCVVSNQIRDAVLFRIRSGKALSGTSTTPPKKKKRERMFCTPGEEFRLEKPRPLSRTRRVPPLALHSERSSLAAPEVSQISSINACTCVHKCTLALSCATRSLFAIHKPRAPL